MKPFLSKGRAPLLPILTLIVAMLSIQSGASLAKQLFPMVGAQGTTLLRTSLAALVLCAIWRPWRAKLTSKQAVAILGYGCALGGMNLLFYMALTRIPLGVAVALEFTGPLGVALFASRQPKDFVWAGLALLGIALVLPLPNNPAALDPLGVALALSAGLSWALYIVFGQRAGSSVSSGVVTALGMLTSAIVVAPFGVYEAGTGLFELAILPLAFGVALLSSALPYSLEMTALKRIPAKNFGILMSMEPAIATLCGLLFLGELLTPLQWTAIACVIFASVGSSASAQPEVITPLPLDATVD